MRFIFPLLVAAAAFGAGPSPREIVERSLEAHLENLKRLQHYNFEERVHKTDHDRRGRPVKTDVKTFDVLFVEGTPYRRLISRFDEPLSPEEEAAEAERLKSGVRDRRGESSKERARRLKEQEERERRIREPLREIPDAFVFRTIEESTIGGRRVWVIAADPRPGYEPRNLRAKLFSGLKGKLWIDKETFQWHRAEGELVEDTWFGLFLLHMHKGGRVEITTRRIDEEVWAPDRLWFTVSLRIGLVKYLGFEQESRYRNYRKFDTDSRILSLQVLP